MQYDDFIGLLDIIYKKYLNFKDKKFTDDNILIILEEIYGDKVNIKIINHLINENKWTIKCINYINNKIIHYYYKKNSIDKILIKLNDKIKTSNILLNIIYQDIYELMNKLEIIHNIYNNINIDSDTETETETETDTDTDKQIESFIKPIDFKFRINQIEAFEKLEKFGLQKGILNSATGTGKSYIIIRYIDYAIRKFKNNCKIILFTERVNILKDLFELDNIDKLKEKILYWQQIGVGDLSNIDIIDRVIIKKHNWVDIFKKQNASLLLINRHFLSNKKLYRELTDNDITLIIHDECHNATSPNCFDIIKYFDDINIPIIGLSATPIRTGNKQIEKLKSIYSVDNKINLIINYGLIFAIEKELIVPPIFNWYYFENFSDDNQDGISDNEVDSILSCLNNKIDDLPYRNYCMVWLY
jgi:hypothetical protein